MKQRIAIYDHGARDLVMAPSKLVRLPQKNFAGEFGISPRFCRSKGRRRELKFLQFVPENLLPGGGVKVEEEK